MDRDVPGTVVIFGVTGDLAGRKLLPAFYHLFLQGRLPDPSAIVGYARTEMTEDDFVERVREQLVRHARHAPDGEGWDRFAQRLSYCFGRFDEPMAMKGLAEHLDRVEERLGAGGGRFLYAATPPVAYPDIVRRVGELGLHRGARILFEKPFGRDLASAVELNRTIQEVFDESQVFRIDHYLGKETVQNILAFRFANGMFEPIWNRRYIDHLQITVAESIGIEGRGGFYEQSGCIRDMVSTHLFQVMTFVAMEPPVAFDPARLRDETVKALRATQACDPELVVRGQYPRLPGGGGRGAGLHRRDVRGHAAARRQLAVGRRPVLPADGQVARAPGQRDHAEVPQGAVRRVPRLGDGAGQAGPPHHPDPARRGDHPRAERQAARAGDASGPGDDGLRLRRGLRRAAHRRRVRGPAARGPAGRPLAVHPPGRCRARVGDPEAGARPARPDPPVRGRVVGPARGRRAHRAPEVARSPATRSAPPRAAAEVPPPRDQG